MPSKKSAGILLYRRRPHIEVLLVHPGGPFWAKKDEGAWSIPKGEFTDEDPLDAARREFAEEMGVPIEGEFAALPSVRQPSGKTIFTFAVEGDLDAESIKSNTFEMEWPRGSGRKETFPEVDEASWFITSIANSKLLPGQRPILSSLLSSLGKSLDEGGGEPTQPARSKSPAQRSLF